MSPEQFTSHARRRVFYDPVERALEPAVNAIRALGGYAGKHVPLPTLEAIAGRQLRRAMDRLRSIGFTSSDPFYGEAREYRINQPADAPTVSYRRQTLRRACILQHFPVRKCLEPLAFELAADRMTQKRVDVAHELMVSLRRAANRRHVERLDERALICQVARWSGNPLVRDLVRLLWLMEGRAYAAIKARAETPEEIRRTQQEFVAILDCLIRGDGLGARQSVQTRLDRLDRLYFRHV